MGTETLVSQQIEAGEEFLKRFNNRRTVDVAFWMLPVDSEDWILHVASSSVDDSSFQEAYGDVLQAASEVRNPWLDPYRIKLIGIADPLATGVSSIRDRYRGGARMGTWYDRGAVAGIPNEGVYIYPEIASAESKA